MSRVHRSLRVLLVVAATALASAGIVNAQPPAPSPAASAGTTAQAPPQGVAVLSVGNARDDAFGLARAVYNSSLRPRTLDELRARILAGDPPPPGASKEVRELAELRGSISGEDAASRRLLTSIAHDVNVQALLVVRRTSPRAQPDEAKENDDAGSPGEGPNDGGPPPSPASPSGVSARLFLADSGDFDAARYEPDESGPTNAPDWKKTVASLAPRFLPPPTPATAQLRGTPPKLSSEAKENKPFYASAWFWGAIGAAVVLGGFFYFASQDTEPGPIHLQMKVPR